MATKRTEILTATGPRLLRRWGKALAVMLTVTLTWVILLLPGSALADDPPAGVDSSEGTGIQVASWALTVPYAICKGAFALGGTAVGSLGYVFSGGNFHTAQTVWTRSIYGTYILRPAHLRGEEPIYFFGKTDGGQSELAPHPVEPTPRDIRTSEKVRR